MECLGIIAGGGRLPFEIAKAAKDKGYELVIIAHEGETGLDIEALGHKVFWVRLGKLGQLLKILRTQSVTKAVLVGTIKKKKMFEGLRPDLKGLRLMARLAVFHDDKILRAVSSEIEAIGVQVIAPQDLLPELLAPEGVLTKVKPTKAQWEDVRFGWEMVKEIGRLDIGQCIVVKDRVVVAVEALEGTDETIRRGAMLAPGATVVKVCKPKQDERFDLPTVGKDTLCTMKEAGAGCLAIEAGKTIIMDREDFITIADTYKIPVVAIRN